VGNAGVITVSGEVVRARFPVAVCAPAMRLTDNLHTTFRDVEVDVEIPLEVAKILLQRGALLDEGGKDHSLVVFHARCCRHAPLAGIEVVESLISQRNSSEVARILERPAVIRTPEV
jgi:hypothetical protein